MASDDRLDIRLPVAEKELFTKAAEADGLTVSMWIRRVARVAAWKLLGREAGKKGGRR